MVQIAKKARRKFNELWAKRSSTEFIVVTVAVALFTDLFLYGVITPILPYSLVNRVGIPPEDVQKAISMLLSVYAVALIVSSSPVSYLADQFSTRKVPMLFGLVFFTFATLLLTLSNTMHILVLARIMQGISASIVWCVGLALVLDAVGPRNVGFTVGGIFGFTSVGEVISPVLGGLIYDSFGYYWAFSTCFVLLIIDIILRCLVLEPREAKKKLSQEEEEHVPILQRQNDFDLETTGKLSAWNSVFLPIYRLTFHRKVCGPYWTSFVNSVLLASFDATVPLELKRLFNFTSAQCGLTFGVLSAPYFFCGPLAGKMVDRRGSKTIGFYAYLALSFTLFLLLIPSSRTTANVVIFIAAMALNGYILAFTSSPGFVQLTAYVTEYEKTHPTFFGPSGPYTQIFSVMNVVYSFGMILGPIIAGYLRIHFGFPATVIFLSLMMLSASLVSYYCFTDNDSEEEE